MKQSLQPNTHRGAEDNIFPGPEERSSDSSFLLISNIYPSGRLSVRAPIYFFVQPIVGNIIKL